MHSNRFWLERTSLLSTLCATALLASCEKSPTPASDPEPATPASTEKAAAPKAAEAPTGLVRTISADQSVLDRPTTGAFVGNDLWVPIGQLTALFSDAEPKLPFRAVSFNATSGQQGQRVIELPGNEFYPEGIAAAADGTLYIGSIPQGVVLKVPAGSDKPEPFVSADTTKRGVIGLSVDEKRNLLWLCDTNPKAPAEQQGGDLVGVSLTDGKEVARHSLPKAGERAPFCNDAIVDPEGNLWITELLGGRIFRVPAAEALTSGPATAWVTGGPLAPPDGKDCCGPNGLELVGDQLIIANSGRGTLVAVDTKGPHTAADARIVALKDSTTSEPMTLCSPDGLALVPGSKDKVVVVENGGCDAKTARIVEVTLSGL